MPPRCQVLYQAFYGIITVNIFITSGSQNYTFIIMIFLKAKKKREREKLFALRYTWVEMLKFELHISELLSNQEFNTVRIHLLSTNYN